MTRSITIEDLYKFKFISHPQITKDGKQVVFVRTVIDTDTYEYRPSIWTVSIDGGGDSSEPQRLTKKSIKAHHPAWSPDGKWIAFIVDPEPDADSKGKNQKQSKGKDKKQEGKDKSQIWVISANGGKAKQLTFMEHGASSPVWSPDSKRLLFSASVGPADEKDANGKPFPKARVIDRLFYRLDGVGYIYERRQHLFLMDVDGGKVGKPEQLTEGDWDDGEVAWSPDGTQIVFASSRREDRWKLPTPDVYTLRIDNGKAGELRCLTDGSLGCSSPSWSHDGQTIAFVGALKLGSGGHDDLYTLPADARESAAHCLTSDFEGSCMDFTNSDIGDEHLVPKPAWSSDDSTLYILAMQRGATRVYAISTGGAGSEPPTLTPGNVHVRDFSADESGHTLALLMADATRPQEIFACTTDTQGELHQLTDFNGKFIGKLELSSPEYMSYTGDEGWPMDGWILKPQNFDPSKKYPLILEIHGGPQTQYGYGFFHEMQLLAAMGYVVLYTNPRGSTGYGRDFSQAVRGEWGLKDSLDIMAGLDALIEKGYIDESRMGVTGGSYGGFMTNWLIGHYDRFHAAVTDRSLYNLATEVGCSDLGWDFIDDNFDVAPWDDMKPYDLMSPMTYLKEMNTPLLIIHSEQDLRCGIEQAEQLFTALKYMGRDVLMVRFEGQSHGLSRGGHPKLRTERLKHITGWFEKYLKPVETGISANVESQEPASVK